MLINFYSPKHRQYYFLSLSMAALIEVQKRALDSCLSKCFAKRLEICKVLTGILTDEEKHKFETDLMLINEYILRANNKQRALAALQEESLTLLARTEEEFKILASREEKDVEEYVAGIEERISSEASHQLDIESAKLRLEMMKRLDSIKKKYNEKIELKRKEFSIEADEKVEHLHATHDENLQIYLEKKKTKLQQHVDNVILSKLDALNIWLFTWRTRPEDAKESQPKDKEKEVFEDVFNIYKFAAGANVDFPQKRKSSPNEPRDTNKSCKSS